MHTNIKMPNLYIVACLKIITLTFRFTFRDYSACIVALSYFFDI